MIVRTLNFCAKIKKRKKNRKKGAHIPASTFFPFLIHHIPFVIPPVWFPETHSVIFLIQQIPLGITSPWFPTMTILSGSKPPNLLLVHAVRFPTTTILSVSHPTGVSNTRSHFHHASTPCGFFVPQTKRSVRFSSKKLSAAVNSF